MAEPAPLLAQGLCRDALTIEVLEAGRVVNAAVMVATGVNADGHY